LNRALKAGSPEYVETVVRLEVREKLFLTTIPEETCRGNRGNRQQTDTKGSDLDLPR
jgi:hypothetical protein